jgi:hypothetical protein
MHIQRMGALAEPPCTLRLTRRVWRGRANGNTALCAAVSQLSDPVEGQVIQQASPARGAGPRHHNPYLSL